MQLVRRSSLVLLASFALVACDNDPIQPRSDFLGGTSDDQQIALVLNSVGRSLNLFQVGAPTQSRQVALGTSQQITPVGFSTRGDNAIIPLGNAGSVALTDLATQDIRRYFIFGAAGANATGSAFVDDNTVLAADFINDRVGRFTLNQTGDTIRQLVAVAPAPIDIEMVGGRAFVVSSNLDENYTPIGNGIVTVLDPQGLAVIGTIQTSGENPTDAAVGPDGLLYVINSGRYDPVTFEPGPGVLTIINPQTRAVVASVPGFGRGPGSITVDERGLAYISGYSLGTLVWDTRTRQFVRGPDNPVCVRVAGACRAAASADADEEGNLYQASPVYGAGTPWVYRFRAGSYEVTDSIAAGSDPTAIRIRTF